MGWPLHDRASDALLLVPEDKLVARATSRRSFSKEDQLNAKDEQTGRQQKALVFPAETSSPVEADGYGDEHSGDRKQTMLDIDEVNARMRGMLMPQQSDGAQYRDQNKEIRPYS